MRALALALLLCTAAVGLASAREQSRHNYRPPAGYVANSTVAVKIAVAIWEPIYGKEEIAEQAPYRATLKGNVWVVQGSLPEGMLGGVAIAEIRKTDGKVLRVSHGK